MEGCSDFMQYLGLDLSTMIFMHLDDPADLARASTVSSSWHQLVIENGIFKLLCLNKFPDIASAFLQGGLAKMRKDCIKDAISASSTDNDPEESIVNTLQSNDVFEHRASYWSSKGENDPTVPETLVYKLASSLCLIKEIHIQPFRAYFQYGFPIYSAKAVRFRMGHRRSDDANANDESTKEFIWTYTSPEYLMTQDDSLQKFKLPEPVICIGGILQVELLGRTQRQEMDNLYYLCVAHVRAIGKSLLPIVDVEVVDENLVETDYSLCIKQPSQVVKHWEKMLMQTLLGTGAIAGHDEFDDDDA